MENSPQLVPPEGPIETLTGSALQRLGTALLAVAKRPSRAAYARWMRVVEPGWVLPLVITAVCLGLLDSIISLGIRTLLTTPGSTSPQYLFGAPSPLSWVINSLVVNPVLGLLSLAVTVYVVAALMSAERGSLNERAFQVARPYLLAQIVITVINIVIGEPAFALGLTGIGQDSLVGFVVIVLNLAVGLYTLIATLNALAAGSGRSRLLIFGVLIPAGFISFLAVWLGLGALLSLIGIHLPIPVFW